MRRTAFRGRNRRRTTSHVGEVVVRQLDLPPGCDPRPSVPARVIGQTVVTVTGHVTAAHARDGCRILVDGPTLTLLPGIRAPDLRKVTVYGGRAADRPLSISYRRSRVPEKPDIDPLVIGCRERIAHGCVVPTRLKVRVLAGRLSGVTSGVPTSRR